MPLYTARPVSANKSENYELPDYEQGFSNQLKFFTSLQQAAERGYKLQMQQERAAAAAADRAHARAQQEEIEAFYANPENAGRVHPYDQGVLARAKVYNDAGFQLGTGRGGTRALQPTSGKLSNHQFDAKNLEHYTDPNNTSLSVLDAAKVQQAKLMAAQGLKPDGTPLPAETKEQKAERLARENEQKFQNFVRAIGEDKTVNELYSTLQLGKTQLSNKKRRETYNNLKGILAAKAKALGLSEEEVESRILGEAKQNLEAYEREFNEAGAGNAIGTFLGNAWQGAKDTIRGIAAGALSEESREAMGKEMAQEQLENIMSNPVLRENALRRQEGEGFFEAMDGATFTNLLGHLGSLAPLIGATILTRGRNLLTQLGAPAVVGAGMGSAGQVQRAANDETLTPEQRSDALSTGALAGAAAVGGGTMAIMPGGIVKGVVSKLPGGWAVTPMLERAVGIGGNRSLKTFAGDVMRNAANAGGAMAANTMGSNAVYNASVGRPADENITEGLEDAMGTAALLAPIFGAMHTLRRPPATPRTPRPADTSGSSLTQANDAEADKLLGVNSGKKKGATGDLYISDKDLSADWQAEPVKEGEAGEVRSIRDAFNDAKSNGKNKERFSAVKALQRRGESSLVTEETDANGNKSYNLAGHPFQWWTDAFNDAGSAVNKFISSIRAATPKGTDGKYTSGADNLNGAREAVRAGLEDGLTLQEMETALYLYGMSGTSSSAAINGIVAKKSGLATKNLPAGSKFAQLKTGSIQGGTLHDVQVRNGIYALDNVVQERARAERASQQQQQAQPQVVSEEQQQVVSEEQPVVPEQRTPEQPATPVEPKPEGEAINESRETQGTEPAAVVDESGRGGENRTPVRDTATDNDGKADTEEVAEPAPAPTSIEANRNTARAEEPERPDAEQNPARKVEVPEETPSEQRNAEGRANRAASADAAAAGDGKADTRTGSTRNTAGERTDEPPVQKSPSEPSTVNNVAEAKRIADELFFDKGDDKTQKNVRLKTFGKNYDGAILRRVIADKSIDVLAPLREVYNKMTVPEQDNFITGYLSRNLRDPRKRYQEIQRARKRAASNPAPQTGDQKGEKTADNAEQQPAAKKTSGKKSSNKKKVEEPKVEEPKAEESKATEPEQNERASALKAAIERQRKAAEAQERDEAEKAKQREAAENRVNELWALRDQDGRDEAAWAKADEAFAKSGSPIRVGRESNGKIPFRIDDVDVETTDRNLVDFYRGINSGSNSQVRAVAQQRVREELKNKAAPTPKAEEPASKPAEEPTNTEANAAPKSEERSAEPAPKAEEPAPKAEEPAPKAEEPAEPAEPDTRETDSSTDAEIDRLKASGAYSNLWDRGVDDMVVELERRRSDPDAKAAENFNKLWEKLTDVEQLAFLKYMKDNLRTEESRRTILTNITRKIKTPKNGYLPEGVSGKTITAPFKGVAEAWLNFREAGTGENEGSTVRGKSAGSQSNSVEVVVSTEDGSEVKAVEPTVRPSTSASVSESDTTRARAVLRDIEEGSAHEVYKAILEAKAIPPSVLNAMTEAERNALNRYRSMGENEAADFVQARLTSRGDTPFHSDRWKEIKREVVKGGETEEPDSINVAYSIVDDAFTITEKFPRGREVKYTVSFDVPGRKTQFVRVYKWINGQQVRLDPTKKGVDARRLFRKNELFSGKDEKDSSNYYNVKRREAQENARGNVNEQISKLEERENESADTAAKENSKSVRSLEAENEANKPKDGFAGDKSSLTANEVDKALDDLLVPDKRTLSPEEEDAVARLTRVTHDESNPYLNGLHAVTVTDAVIERIPELRPFKGGTAIVSHFLDGEEPKDIAFAVKYRGNWYKNNGGVTDPAFLRSVIGKIQDSPALSDVEKVTAIENIRQRVGEWNSSPEAAYNSFDAVTEPRDIDIPRALYSDPEVVNAKGFFGLPFDDMEKALAFTRLVERLPFAVDKIYHALLKIRTKGVGVKLEELLADRLKVPYFGRANTDRRFSTEDLDGVRQFFMDYGGLGEEDVAPRDPNISRNIILSPKSSDMEVSERINITQADVEQTEVNERVRDNPNRKLC